MAAQYKLLSIFFAAIVIVAIFLYNPLLLFFQNDDFIHIPMSEKGIWFQRGSFRPVGEIFIKIDSLIWGKNAWGYHLTNLLLHILSGWLVYLFSNEFFKTLLPVRNCQLIAFLTGLLFFIYAMHSEAVFWILGRSALLSTIFSLVFLFGYLKIPVTGRYYILCLAAFFLALLTYESSWMLVLYAILISIKRTEKIKDFRNETKFLFILVLSFVLYLSVRFNFTGKLLGNYLTDALNQADFFTPAQNFLILIARSFIPPLSSGKIIITGFLLTYMAFFILFLKMNKMDKKQLLIILLFFLTSLLPFIGLGVDSYGTESERFLYFPSIFLCCFFSRLIVSPLRSELKAALFSLLIVLHLFALNQAAQNYRDAGEVVQQILSELKKLKDGTELEVISLPQNQKGAHIFRSGLEEMSDWYGKKLDITISSAKFELVPLTIPLQVEYETPNALNQIIPINENKKHFLFTDSHLFIY